MRLTVRTFLTAGLFGCHLVDFLTARAFFEHCMRLVNRTFLRQTNQGNGIFLMLTAAVVHTAQVGFVDSAFFGVDVEFFQAFEELALLAAGGPDEAAGGCGDDDGGEQDGEGPGIDDEDDDEAEDGGGQQEQTADAEFGLFVHEVVFLFGCKEVV